MKRFALLFLVAFTALSGYAQTTLTLEDAVLNGRKYYPQGLDHAAVGSRHRRLFTRYRRLPESCCGGRKIWRRNRTHHRR